MGGRLTIHSPLVTGADFNVPVAVVPVLENRSGSPKYDQKSKSSAHIRGRQTH